MSTISELEGHIKEALENILAVDFLANSPCEPFMDLADFTGIFAPSFFCNIQDVDRLHDFLHSIEKSGFVENACKPFPKWDDEMQAEQHQYGEFITSHNEKTITFRYAVMNKVLFEYELDERLGSIK